MDVKIIRERSSDVEAISTVTAQAFLNAEHTSHTEHVIVAELRAAGALHISLVAEQGGHLVGHVAVSPVRVTDGSEGWFGLGPISVLPDYQNEGIGSLLMTEVFLQMREAGANGCVVLGDPNFYSRFGFSKYDGLRLPGVPAEYFQALAFTGSVPIGDVSYHQAFNAGS